MPVGVSIPYVFNTQQKKTLSRYFRNVCYSIGGGILFLCVCLFLTGGIKCLIKVHSFNV